jgi:proteic killer suppression protein
MIRSFRCSETEGVFHRQRSKRFRSIERIALRKLLQLEASDRLEDLRVPPANRLEKLHGDRAGQHSVRINDQWRVCFRWREGAAWDVEIVDYQ